MLVENFVNTSSKSQASISILQTLPTTKTILSYLVYLIIIKLRMKTIHSEIYTRYSQ